ncbi:MAG TPA: LysR family transcriptional regulator [Xanthobacteraceae bacterium]|nr:LysR family transcriptional regulator [Xanthobacteraceae bacterium]
MELHQIRYFLALCEELNFTRAAQRCHVAQSSLTRAIRALESELGGALFHRERGNSHLSQLGQRVRPLLEQAYGHVEGAKRQAKHFLRLETRTLRLGLMRTLCGADIVALIGALASRHASVALQAQSGCAQALQARLLAGELDAAIYALPDLARDQRLDRLPLYREPLVVLVHGAHRLAQRGAIRAEEIAGEPIVSRTRCEYDAAAGQALARLGAEGPVVLQSERDDWVLALVAAGLGIALMPASIAAHAGVAALRLTEPEIAREISLVTARGRPDSPLIGALVREATRMRWAGSSAQAALGAAAARARAKA